MNTHWHRGLIHSCTSVSPLVADGETHLPPQEAATADHRKPRLFDRSDTWKMAMEDFFHGQLSTVLKLGGSLLGRPTWPEDILTLLDGIASPLIVVGGGSLVDGLRMIDQARPQPVALMHELAIEAMTLTGRIVAAAIGLPIVTVAEPTGGVLDVAAWLRASGAGHRLPPGWQVTSDSIAAVVASDTGRGLMLAKSLAPPCRAETLEQLADAGWVDAHFPTSASSLGMIAWAAPNYD